MSTGIALVPERLPRLRQFVVGFCALAVSFPVVWVGLAKFCLFVISLGLLLWPGAKPGHPGNLPHLSTSKVILLSLGLFALSLCWTDTDAGIALHALVKHGKLLVPLLLVFLIRSEHQARQAITLFVAGQAFLLLSSWLLALGLPLPWVTAAVDPFAWSSKYAVFSSYLDQSVMFASSLGLIWHLRYSVMSPPWLGVLLCIGSLANVLLLLESRTGYLIAAASVTVALTVALPRGRRWWATVAIPLALIAALYASPVQVRERWNQLAQEVSNAVHRGETDSSTGFRLNAWRYSLQALSESPWAGHGVGSWTVNARRIEGSPKSEAYAIGAASNPHQEFLLWAVELGWIGPCLLLGLLYALLADARRFAPPVRAAVQSMVLALLITCLFNSALYDALMGDYFCVALGLLLALGLNSPRWGQTKELPT